MDICNHKQLLSTMNLVLGYLNGNQLYCGYLSMKSEEYPFTEVEEKIEQQKDAFHHNNKVERAKIVLGEKYLCAYRDWETDRKSTRLNSSHRSLSRMPSSA